MTDQICKPDECPYELDCEPWEDHEGEEVPEYCPFKDSREKHVLL